MKDFVHMLSKYTEYIASLDISDNKILDNLKRLSISEKFWVKATKQNNFPFSSNFQTGDIVSIDYGKNIIPEMSFIHMGLIVRAKGKYLYTLPITTLSINNPAHTSAYHPVLNPNGFREFALMPASEFPFLAHDSVIKLNDIKTVSTKRFKRKISHINPNNDFFKKITTMAFSQTYPNLFGEYINLHKENSLLKMQLFLSNLENNYLVKSLDELKSVLFIPDDYKHEFSAEENINEEMHLYKVTLMLDDKFHQKVSKEITYTKNR